jgi:putative hydrolase of the HAD superfamily
VGLILVRRGAEALGSPDEGRLRGLHEPAQAGFAPVAEWFTPTARAAPQKNESHPPADVTEKLRYTNTMQINTILFDLDDTLYPRGSGVGEAIGDRMTEYVMRRLGVDAKESRRLRHHFLTTYGTTMRGLQIEHGIDIEEYMGYVHDIDMAVFLRYDARLDAQLGAVGARKAIFTNAPIEHAGRVLAALAVRHHFEHVFDIRFAGFLPKPNLSYYHAALGVMEADARRAALVEDTAQNIPPARSLGMTTIFIGPEGASEADYTAPDIYTALETLQRLSAG